MTDKSDGFYYQNDSFPIGYNEWMHVCIQRHTDQRNRKKFSFGFRLNFDFSDVNFFYSWF